METIIFIMSKLRLFDNFDHIETCIEMFAQNTFKAHVTTRLICWANETLIYRTYIDSSLSIIFIN